MDVDFEGLGGFVVDDRVDALDVETTRCEICGKEMGDLAVPERLYVGDTLCSC